MKLQSCKTIERDHLFNVRSGAGNVNGETIRGSRVTAIVENRAADELDGAPKSPIAGRVEQVRMVRSSSCSRSSVT